jgi:hypothetical protein
VALGNTPRKETNISVEASKSYAFGVRFQHLDKTPVDMEDIVVRLVASEDAYRGGSEVLSLEGVHIGDDAGLVQFQFQAEDLALDPGQYPYDVTIIPESGYSTPVLKGYIEVGNNQDLDASNRYGMVLTGSEVTAIIENGDLVEITIERIDGLSGVVLQMISEFREEVTKDIDRGAAAATEAKAWASQSKYYADELRAWLQSVGFPFWKGTQAEYDALPNPDPLVLYLITDGVAP